MGGSVTFAVCEDVYCASKFAVCAKNASEVVWYASHRGEMGDAVCRCCTPPVYGMIWAFVSVALMGVAILLGIKYYKDPS